MSARSVECAGACSFSFGDIGAIVALDSVAAFSSSTAQQLRAIFRTDNCPVALIASHARKTQRDVWESFGRAAGAYTMGFVVRRNTSHALGGLASLRTELSRRSEHAATLRCLSQALAVQNRRRELDI